MYHPSFGIVADYWLLGAVVAVFQRRHRDHRQSLGHPFRDSQARQPETPHHAGDALSGVIPQNNCGTLRLPKRHCARTLHLLQFRPVFIRQNQLGSPRFTCHAQAYQETILFVYVLMKRYTSPRSRRQQDFTKRSVFFHYPSAPSSLFSAVKILSQPSRRNRHEADQAMEDHAHRTKDRPRTARTRIEPQNGRPGGEPPGLRDYGRDRSSRLEATAIRSEERRVGKEGRSRWSPD